MKLSTNCARSQNQNTHVLQLNSSRFTGSASIGVFSCLVFLVCNCQVQICSAHDRMTFFLWCSCIQFGFDLQRVSSFSYWTFFAHYRPIWRLISTFIWVVNYKVYTTNTQKAALFVCTRRKNSALLLPSLAVAFFFFLLVEVICLLCCPFVLLALQGPGRAVQCCALPNRSVTDEKETKSLCSDAVELVWTRESWCPLQTSSICSFISYSLCPSRSAFPLLIHFFLRTKPAH